MAMTIGIRRAKRASNVTELASAIFRNVLISTAGSTKVPLPMPLVMICSDAADEFCNRYGKKPLLFAWGTWFHHDGLHLSIHVCWPLPATRLTTPMDLTLY
jgi:hypothetical protein